MLKPGRIKEIMEEIGKVKVAVVALLETRWQGQWKNQLKRLLFNIVDPRRELVVMGQDLL